MLVAINDKPLTPDQRRAEDSRLAKLITNPKELRKKQRAEKEEAPLSSPAPAGRAYRGAEGDRHDMEILRQAWRPQCYKGCYNRISIYKLGVS